MFGCEFHCWKISANNVWLNCQDQAVPTKRFWIQFLLLDLYVVLTVGRSFVSISACKLLLRLMAALTIVWDNLWPVPKLFHTQKVSTIFFIHERKIQWVGLGCIALLSITFFLVKFSWGKETPLSKYRVD